MAHPQEQVLGQPTSDGAGQITGPDSTRALEDLRTRLARAEADAEGNAAKASELQRAADQATKERRDALALLDARTAALKEAEAYLTKVDDIPDAEVIQLVQRLNAQIAKVAETIVSSPAFAFSSSRRAQRVSEGASAVEALKRGEWVGPTVLDALRASRDDGPPALLKTALQTGIVTYACWLASSWDLDAFEPAGLLPNLYARIRAKGAFGLVCGDPLADACRAEPQSIAGRWRALSRKYVKSLLETGEIQTQRLFDTLAGLVADVLVAAGVEGSRQEVVATLAREFESLLYDITSLALEFQWTAGERIVSRDFTVYTVEIGSAFSAAGMEREAAGKGRSSSSGIVAMTALGVRVERKAGGNGEVTGEAQAATVLKAKVMLVDVV